MYDLKVYSCPLTHEIQFGFDTLNCSKLQTIRSVCLVYANTGAATYARLTALAFYVYILLAAILCSCHERACRKSVFFFIAGSLIDPGETDFLPTLLIGELNCYFVCVNIAL